MKKNLFVLLGFLVVIVLISAMVYYNYQKKLILSKKANSEFNEYTSQEITGSALMTLINKVSDQNEKNGVQKGEKNRYIENGKDSIKIEVKFLESDEIYVMEAISNLGSEKFIKNYNNIKFRCTKIAYHEKTNKIKYMLFEQI